MFSHPFLIGGDVVEKRALRNNVGFRFSCNAGSRRNSFRNAVLAITNSITNYPFFSENTYDTVFLFGGDSKISLDRSISALAMKGHQREETHRATYYEIAKRRSDLLFKMTEQCEIPHC